MIPQMDVLAIALPHGATLVWIRVGSPLDPLFAHRPGEIVRRIVRTGMAFRVETSGTDAGEVRHYETCSQVVSRVRGLDVPTAC